jgi:phage tail tape-measure protein
VKRPRVRVPGLPANEHVTAEAVGLAGAVAGALVGAVAGPIGAVAGAAVGAVAGAASGAAAEELAHVKEVHDEALDEEIGVRGGTLGSIYATTEPARVGAFSAGSAGVATADEAQPDEGPIPKSD